MDERIEKLLHSRILKHCWPLCRDGHHRHAAREAMVQVELALKEKSGGQDTYGVNLVATLFGEGRGIKLRVPFGEDMQKQAEALFRGAFSYYRNYAAHDGSRIDERICLRILVLASELLDLIGASAVSFADVGGITGLVQAGIFVDADNLGALLHLLEGRTLPDDAIEWIEDFLLEHGYTFTQVQAVIDVGLVEYTSQEYVVPYELLHERDTLPNTIGWFRLTDLGKQMLANRHGR